MADTDVQLINVPGVGPVNFPNSMSDSDVLAAVKKLSAGAAPKQESAGPFDPETAGFGGRVVNAAVDVPVGMAKGAAQLAYAIPGVQGGIESMWGLPKDSLSKAVESTNDSQGAGKLIDVALGAKAVGSIPAGRTVTPYVTAGGTKLGIINPETVASRIGDLSMKTLAAVKTEVLGSGPVTTEKVAGAIAKYGVSAVKVALGGKIFGQFVK